MNPRSPGRRPPYSPFVLLFPVCALLARVLVADAAEPARDPAPSIAQDAALGQAPAPTGSLRLADALAAALAGSPSLAARSLEIRRREALALQAARRPNPSVILQAEDFAGPSQKKSLAYQQTTLSLAQLVELGGKRSARRAVAERDRDVASRDFEVLRVAVLADAAKTFLAVLALQEQRRLLGELEAVAAEMLRSVASTVRAGAVSPVEEERARVHLDRVRLDIARSDHELAGARALLAASWGQTEAGFREVVGELSAIPPLPEAARVLALVDESPELARWNAEIAQREAVVAVERAARIPDVEVSLGARHHPLDDKAGVVGGLSVPLPIFDRNRDNRRAAAEALAIARLERRAREVSLRSTLVASHQSLALSHRMVATLRDEIVPRAQRVFEQTRRGYATGLFRYVEVLDAQRTLFTARRELLDALLALHLTATDLERMTATPIAEMSGGMDR